MILKDVVRITNEDFKNSLAFNLFGKDFNTAKKENEYFVNSLYKKASKVLTEEFTPHYLTKFYPDEVFSQLLSDAKIENACAILNNLGSFVRLELCTLDYIVVDIQQEYFKVVPLGCFDIRMYPELFKFLSNYKFISYKEGRDYWRMGCSFQRLL